MTRVQNKSSEEFLRVLKNDTKSIFDDKNDKDDFITIDNFCLPKTIKRMKR